MKRVVVIGSAGSGKSTLAKQIGQVYQYDVIHMDRLFWKPGWKESTQEELREKQAAYLQKNKWVIEGNYSGVWKERLEMADTIIFIDVNRYVCLYSALKRWVQNIGKTREDIGPGCPERMELAFLKYIWDYPKTKRNKAMTAIEQHCQHAQIFIFPHRKAVNLFIKKIKTLS
ncbi:topology modulation protein [Halobacillus shinanisalinarum]|uniref:Topology modulation protein n=1 Tax=Halobacillus shinanisalinarum TaxID=2932258 RepID=A0ABY4GZN5_9BACI|nr:topology modulation protein [Halobacillus shinanisalinarum]UOQ93496.1 topology modulation protein [Halobacillus shinanisalinarum]